MALVELVDVAVSFPLYGLGAHSLKRRLAAAATGGRIGTHTGVTVIEALRNISLKLRDGDRLGIVGHNGSGKSTLLRTLAGVYPPDKGSYSRQGAISSFIDPTLGIEVDATGYENMYILGLLRGLRTHTIRASMREIAEFSGLGDYLEMPVRTYSTGMIMRLAFSIATSSQPEILLMDEWLAVGDAEFQQRAEARLQEVLANTGILVLASHSAELVNRECTSIVELSHGEIARWILPSRASSPT